MSPESEKNTPPLVPEGIARGAGEENPALIGGYCPDCRRTFFPRPRYCSQCLTPPRECELSGDGVIYSYTVVRTRPPLGLPQPYAVGYIDLRASGLRIFGLLDPQDIDELAIGAPVHLQVGLLGTNLQGEPCRRPYFSLTAREAAHD